MPPDKEKSGRTKTEIVDTTCQLGHCPKDGNPLPGLLNCSHCGNAEIEVDGVPWSRK